MVGFRLSGVALVTGGASGIGQACALGFAAEGAAAVVVADINLELATAVAEECKGVATHPSFESLAIKVDVANNQSVQDMVSSIVEKFGRIDYNVNSAGVAHTVPTLFPDVSVEEVERLHTVNVLGMLHCVQAVARVIEKQEPLEVAGRAATKGSIVNIASSFATSVTQTQTPYSMSKHAVLGLTKNAAIDLASRGIRVNAVLPGFIDTPMMRGYAEGAEVPAAVHGMVERWVPVKRMGQPEEVADVALFLSSPRASFVYGAAWAVDGAISTGLHMGI